MILTKSRQNKLKKLRESNEWCCITIHSDYDYVWTIDIIRSNEFSKDDKHEITLSSGACEDLNEAVDIIYKKAKDFLKKEKDNV